MRIFRDISNLPKFTNAVISIGSFDGVHKGHQQLLLKIKQLAKKCEGESILITFHPHPRTVIYPKNNDLSLLNTLEEKLELCKIHGIDNVVIVPFTIEFGQQTAQEYVENFLIQSFTPKYIVIGYDHKFGINRSGNIDLLKQYEEKNFFKLIEIKKHELEDIAVSSSKIRKALSISDIETATNYLGAPYKLSGTIVHGDRIGHTIGFPTANILLSDPIKLIPNDGVYAVICYLENEKYNGMMYIGRRPTVSLNQPHKSIEINIFDFNQDIYGEKLEIEIIEHIRHDEQFESLEHLKSQLQKDKIKSEEILTHIISTKNEIKKKDKVCIAILNYNGVEYLESFLPSILYSSRKPINISVIDNDSTDDSLQYLNDWHPEIKVIELNKNHGFAGGYNEGIRQIDAKYIVLLNSDVLVEKYWLDPIIEHMDNDESIGVCQPKILSLENKYEFEYAGASGGYIDSLGYPYCRGRIFDTIEKDFGQYDDIRDVDWASGAAMVIRKDLFEKLGGFDKDYFAHMEEIDLCWRVRRAGLSINVVPKGIVYHLGGGTLDYINPRKVYLNFRNNHYTLLKNVSLTKLLWLFPLRLMLDGMAGLKYMLEGKPKSTFAIIKAHLSVYRKFGHTIRKRAVYHRLISDIKKNTPVNLNSHRSILISYYIKGKKVFSDL